MKLSKHVSIILLSSLSFSVQAYSVGISLDVSVNEVSNVNTDVQISCALNHAEIENLGVSYVTLAEGAYNGNVEVAIEATKPLSSYEGVRCEMHLCRAQRLDACSIPISSSAYNVLSEGGGPTARYSEHLVYDENAANQISYAQDYASSLVLVTPPPSYQVASQQNKSANNKAGSSGSSNKQKSATLGETASDVNGSFGYLELGLAVGEFVATRNVGALSDVVMSGLGVGINAGFGQFNGNAAGIVGDGVGFGISILGAYAAGASGVAVTSASAVALPLIGAGSAGVALGTKLDKALNQPVLQLLEATVGYDDEDPAGYKAAVAAMEKRKKKQAAQASASNTEDTGARQGGLATGSVGQDTRNQNADNQGGKAPVSKTPTETNDATAGNPENDNNNGQQSVGGNTNVDQNVGASTAEYTVTGRTSEGGVTTITWTASGTGGQDGLYFTEYYSDGTYSVFNMWGQEVGSGTGTPGNGAVPGASSTETSDDGSEAVFSSDEDDEDDGSEDDGSDDDSSDDDCKTEAEGCSDDTEEEPSEDEEAEAESTDTSKDSTPTPDGDDNMRAGVAWAMKNPDNPFAQNILKQAAEAISERSGRCLTGCADVEEDGGVLWAMNNPDNPIAQSILATTAQAIQENSGEGQAGGPSDNPENQPIGDEVTEAELIQLEFIVSGGGLVDPPEDSGSGSAPNDPDTPVVGGQPITGGNPASDMTVHTNDGVMLDGNGDGSGDPDDPEDGIGEIQIDEGNLRSGVAR